MDDETLYHLLQTQPEAGMEALLRQYAPLLHYVIGGVLRNPQDAEDCFSEVSLALWKSLQSYEPARGRLSAYLTTIARNTALNFLKASLRREQHRTDAPIEDAASSDTPEQQILRQEQMEQLKVLLERLPAIDRKLFYRRYYYLQPISQIAAELGLSLRAAEGRLYRLRQRLRQELGGDL